MESRPAVSTLIRIGNDAEHERGARLWIDDQVTKMSFPYLRGFWREKGTNHPVSTVIAQLYTSQMMVNLQYSL